MQRAIRLLNLHALQNGLHILPEASNVLLAQGGLLGQFCIRQRADLLDPGQFIDAINLFFFHMNHPFLSDEEVILMVQGKWFPMGADFSEALAVRQAVFATGTDELDPMAQQVVVYREGKPVGSARLYWLDGAFQLDKLGVLEEERDKGYGDLLIRLLLFKALTHSASIIRLETPAQTQPFFAKYGFVVDSETNGLTRMHILGENVQLSHCGGNCASCANRTEECVPKALRG